MPTNRRDVLLAPSTLSAVAALVLLASACADDAPGRDDDGPGGTIAFPDCHYELDDVEVGVIEAEAWEQSPSFARLGDDLVVQRRGTEASNSPHDLELVAVEPSSGATRQLTANDVDDQLLDGRDGTLLYQSYATNDATGQLEPQLIVERGGSATVVAEVRATVPSYVTDQAVRLVSDEMAAWLAYVETDEPGRWAAVVSAHVDGRTHRVSDGLEQSRMPDVRGREVTWVASDGTSFDVYWATVEQGQVERRRLTSTEEDDRVPKLAGGGVYWLSQHAPMRFDLEAGRAEVLADVDCFDLAADGDRVAFLCEGLEDQGYIWPARGRSLWVADETSGDAVVDRVYTSDEWIYEVAVSSDATGVILAWVTYPQLDEPFDTGTVWLFRTGDAGAEPVAVSPIGSGCWYCDAIWPPPTLGLYADLLVWNYGLEEGDDEQGVGPWGVGYATIGAGLVCTGR